MAGNFGWYLDSWIGLISGDCGYQMQEVDCG